MKSTALTRLNQAPRYVNGLLPIDVLVHNQCAQVRGAQRTDQSERIDELANSIARSGLFNPSTVAMWQLRDVREYHDLVTDLFGEGDHGPDQFITHGRFRPCLYAGHRRVLGIDLIRNTLTEAQQAHPHFRRKEPREYFEWLFPDGMIPVRTREGGISPLEALRDQCAENLTQRRPGPHREARAIRSIFHLDRMRLGTGVTYKSVARSLGIDDKQVSISVNIYRHFPADLWDDVEYGHVPWTSVALLIRYSQDLRKHPRLFDTYGGQPPRLRTDEEWADDIRAVWDFAKNLDTKEFAAIMRERFSSVQGQAKLWREEFELTPDQEMAIVFPRSVANKAVELHEYLEKLKRLVERGLITTREVRGKVIPVFDPKVEGDANQALQAISGLDAGIFRALLGTLPDQTVAEALSTAQASGLLLGTRLSELREGEQDSLFA